MIVRNNPTELSRIPGSIVLAVGVFDGVHLGHCAVLGEALRVSARRAATAVAVTFDPHPMKILRPGSAPRLLTSTPHKLRLIESLGFREALVLTFDANFASQDAAVFVRDLASHADLAGVCVGEGWRFGRGRTGDASLLRDLGADLGFDTHEVAPVVVDGKVASSTLIRAAVESGDFAAARRYLGRDYTILGTVTPGDGLGRRLGFPTANLAAHNEQFPPDGVYAVRADWNGRALRGVANIGVRPTVSAGRQRLLEVHFFDLEEDLYGADIEVTFAAYLRPERAFPDTSALAAQITQDAAQARGLLAEGI